ncbi:type I restriction enzyme, R subunit [Nocardia amikacinitolerans]|uniref:type I restriction endonuclease subunit R n=1 Tax=Nocardia amikacinitolerans TaxID=756689 RepID=UPI00082E1DD0|nr:HsdR family type I site-specific deoxyribonuclease [Nocardia amikacinitolerans]MCP2318257.1 type I restriction enzyme, R subunit [Nocardia amikacinitolerans]
MTDYEYTLVERPLIEQLKGMGWEHLAGAQNGDVVPRFPGMSARRTFDEVILEGKLRGAIERINGSWLDDLKVGQAFNALTRVPATSLLEANQQITELLFNGIPIEDPMSGKTRIVHYIDWQNPGNNEYTAINQFRVDIPGTSGRQQIVPDIVLFVNGIPLVVIECKKTTESSLNVAVNQIRRYCDSSTGNPKLFQFVQLTAVTSGEDAKLGTLTAKMEHYVPWRDPYPLTKAQLAERLGKDAKQVSRQEILAAGALAPARLLNILHNFVTFMTTDEGVTVKVAPRYQQFRAVERTVHRLLTGEPGAKGGIIWHTQGSGKSLTMTFLVRRLRSISELAHYKVVVVTDRTQLQDQLSETMQLSNEKLDIAKSSARAKTLLSRIGPGLVFVMIQKNQTGAPIDKYDMGEVNTDDSIVVLIDEVHRSHTAALGANLRRALPNAARIGFTGTPIMTKRGQRKTSVELFGPFIDTYRLRDAETDGVIVPILYQGFKVKGALQNGQDMDELFEEEFEDLTEGERQQLQTRWATKGQVSVAQKLLDIKAKHMFRHYVDMVLPEGFKAQVVAHDRETTVRYREALMQARDELVRDIDKLPPHLLTRSLDELRPRHAQLVKAHKQLDLIKRMDFVPVISKGDSEQEGRYTEWTDEAKQKLRIEGFTRPFGENDIAFVIVKSMLLTGFDAPIEQVMYLDRRMEMHDLLQAVARVNRTADGKPYGYVVDYRGVAQSLVDALKIYADEEFELEESDDIASALRNLETEITKLDPQRQRLRMMFRDHTSIEECVRELADSQLRDRFNVELARFARTVNTILPDPAATPYLEDAKRFSVIKLTANRRYRVDGGEFDPGVYGQKIKLLIDEHVTSLGIEQQLPPIALTADNFADKVEAMTGGSRAKASEMEHALRHHITVHASQDPARYKLLSERLEQILTELKDDWNAQLSAFKNLIADVMDDRRDNPHNFSPAEFAIYGLLVQELATSADDIQDERFADASREIVALARRTIHRRDFWSKRPDVADFRSEIFEILVMSDLGDLQNLELVADKVRDVVKNNHMAIPKD